MKKTFRGMILAGTGLMLVSTTAHAQSAPAAPEEQSGLKDIVVTAQKRQENLQEVPIAISAITGESLASSGINNTEVIGAAVPGITMTRQSGATMIYIRGIGTTGGQAGQEGAVATFVDGVYQPSMVGSTFAFNNVERIEVLKGPQGTLYGRNATGGAVNVITRDPSFTPTASGEFSYGNRDNIEANAYLSTGITDNVAIDLAGMYNDLQDGFGVNLVTGTKVNTRRDWGLRSKLLFTPGPDTKITISGDYSEGRGSYGVSYSPVAGTTQAILGPAPADLGGSRFNIMSDLDPMLDSKSWGVSGRIEQNIGSLRMTSITAYRELQQSQYFDLDAGPLALATADLHEKNWQFTQELQLSNGNSTGLKWMLGLFYLDSSAKYAPFDLRGAAFEQLFASSPFAALMPYGQNITDEQRTKSYAIFGQATYPLTDHLNITAGARYTSDVRDLSYDFALVVPTLVDPSGYYHFPAGSNHIKFNEPTWRIALDYKVNDDVMVYGSYSRGFKSGVFNLTSPLDPAVRPEKLDAYEVGVKSELFDRTLRLNLSGFYYKYDNIQLTVIQGGAQTLINAAKADVKGIEADFQWAPTKGLQFSGGFQYIDGKYTDFPLTPVSTLTTAFPWGINITPTYTSGNQLVRAPKFSANLGVDYSVPVGAHSELGFNLTYQYNDGYPFEPDGRLRQSAYNIVNSSIRYAINEHATVRVWARNLFDERYYIQGTTSFLGDLQNAAPGRQYGVGLGLKF